VVLNNVVFTGLNPSLVHKHALARKQKADTNDRNKGEYDSDYFACAHLVVTREGSETTLTLRWVA
jgi:hypothetical protein